MLKEKHTRKLINITLFFLIIFIVNNISDLLEPFFDILKLLITPTIIALFLYYALRPLVEKLSPKDDKYKGLITIAAFIFIFTILGLLIYFGGALVKAEFEDSFFNNKETFNEYTKIVTRKFEEFNLDSKYINQIFSAIQSGFKNITANTFNIFSSIGNIGTQIILVPIILFYLLKDDKLFLSNIKKIIPDKYKKQFNKVGQSIDNQLSIYIGGQMLVALIIGFLMFIGYLILGVENAVLMAVFCTITAIIPMIGPFLGILPAILVALTVNLGLVLKIIILAIIVQQIEGDLITPKIMGDKLELHPLTVLFVILIGVHLIGVFGALIGIPLYLIIKTILMEIYSQKLK